jgi:NSS family neurotransmitter:Na+ symporter
MAAIGSAIGLGNVWRFPYICYKYGGGAFLIPWIVGLVVLGIPWFIIEMGMGHWIQGGAPQCLRSVGKKWEWAGWLPVLSGFMITTYYCVIIAWSLCYMVYSCWMAWGAGAGAAQTVGPFFNDMFLGLTEGPGVLGRFNLPIIGGLIVTWVAIFLILIKGPRRVGKVALYTVTIPWACLVILAIRGLTLPGAIEGLNYYLTPNFSALLDGEVWFGAFSQIAFTLSLGQGVMFAYGSYLPRKSDVNNNIMITSFANCATSFFAGFAIFSTLGFLAYSLGVGIPEAVTSGHILAFVSIPMAISMMPVLPQIIGIVLFICLFTLGIDSAFALIEGASTALMDKFKISRIKILCILCSASFLAGVFIFSRGGGLHWLDMVDRSVCFYGLLVSGLFVCLVVGWTYTSKKGSFLSKFGASKLREHVNAISDFKIGKWFDVLVMFIVPAGLIFVIGWGIKTDIGGYGEYPLWASTLGVWGVFFSMIAISIILSVIKGKREVKKEVIKRRR